MKCHECQEQLALYAEDVLDAATAQAVQDHLRACAACRAADEATRGLRDRLMAVGERPIRTGLDQRVMDRIRSQQVELTGRLKMRRRIQKFGWAALAASLLVGVTWAAFQWQPARATATEIIARGAQAAADLKSIYIKCRMRTLPGDNFQLLAPEQGFVDVELWKKYGSPLKWKVQKPGRVVVMDGQETVLLYGNRFGVKFNAPSPAGFDTDWLHELAAIDKMLASELDADGGSATVQKDDSETAPNQVTVEVRASDKTNAYLQNKFLQTSNTRREYTFDRETGRLEQAKFYCQIAGSDVLVVEIVEIKYDPPLDDATFVLDAPDDVIWRQEPQRLVDNEKYEKMTPAEAARTFFEACGERNWDEAAKFFPTALTDDFKTSLGGLEIVSLGQPFQAWPYGGWFVPYEVRFNNGQVRKHNLALRNDNAAKRFVVDGGL